MCYSQRYSQIEEEALRMAQEKSNRKSREGRTKRGKKERVADKVRELVRA